MRYLGILATLGLLLAAGSSATAVTVGPIAFVASDYDNAASQTTGLFRDFLGGSYINQGVNFGSGLYTSLNFSGSAGAGGGSRATVYDTTPADGNATMSLWQGSVTISMDILHNTFNNGKSVGPIALFNEGVGEEGLGLLLWDAGNSDRENLQIVYQTGLTSTTLAYANLGSQIAENKWYNLTMEVTVSGDTVNVLGTVFKHTTETDPNSLLGLQLGSTLLYTGSMSTLGLTSPGEVGIAARAVSTTFNSSVTNFEVEGIRVPEPVTTIVPEPVTATGLLLGLGCVGRYLARRRREA